ncbi:MAG: MoaD/ThiS family protein [Ardenticatenaceae bacterium]|nr:MoaD/ThiS family protein [Anaerolineales bacterium]MCB8976978.1 MoaD/ThiS family protein [Ardenticatenaceae bacterium]
MKVEVKLYGMLRANRPVGVAGAPHRPFDITLQDGATAVQVAKQLEINEGLLATVAINGQTAELDTVLQDGDQISLFPPSAGGSEPLRVFLAGVMQANRQDTLMESQDYRLQLSDALRRLIPDVQLIDPWAENPGSLDYDDDQARHTFVTMTNKASEADLLIAYLPLPSMGTAMEMWQAFQNNTYIIAITPFVHHWAIRFTANDILPDMDSLMMWLENGRFLQEIVPAALARRQS